MNRYITWKQQPAIRNELFIDCNMPRKILELV
jgi:hypothetical protein